jgi:hypothetical protein
VSSGTDASYYQLELSAPYSWINPFHEKLFEYSGCRLPQRHSIRIARVRQSLHFLEHPQLFFELAACDPFLDSERNCSRYNLTASRALFPHRAKVRIISTYSEEEYMLNDTLELNIAAKLYNKCQTDVNNHSNKYSGPNLMDSSRLCNNI